MDYYQYPSVALTRKHSGDEDLSRRYRGEADKLLYQLKNLMKFRQLGQLKMTRFFTDGTIITAWSIFGQDFVNIDVRETIPEIIGVRAPEKCTITFIDLPDAVQPMRYPGHIVSGEIKGIDYIKTYYTIDISKCPTCTEIQWDFLLNYTEPEEIRHWVNPITGEHEYDNHTVYSSSPPAWGEIIKHGSDDGGDYIIWKAYTETGDISRTGLAVPLLRALINDTIGTEMCSQQAKIDVDCCLRQDISKPEIYWEAWELADCSTFLMYGNIKLCKVPDDIPFGHLMLYASAGGGYFYAISGCLDYEWTASFGRFVDIGQYGKVVRWQPPIGYSTWNCKEDNVISTTDRCGETDSFRAIQCCEQAGPLSILYTSLVMGCSQQQTFTAKGGCGPYTWAITSGGGSISYYGVGAEAIYASPSTNPNCVSNPTITLTDCCGTTAQIKLAINCYTPTDSALGIVDHKCYWFWISIFGCNQGWYICQSFHRRDWSCDGVLRINCETRPDPSTCPNLYPPPIACGSGYCGQPIPPNSCWQAQCGCINPSNCPCNILLDRRTQNMLNGGCCPLNPFTGLPY